MEFFCKCQSPLDWHVEHLGDSPICKSCGREVSKERSLEEMDRKFHEIGSMINFNKLLDITKYLVFSVGAIAVFTLLAYDFDTGFWFDTPFTNPDYYVFHPHRDDTCADLQSKYNLYHPEGTNPVKFQLYDRMIEMNCLVR